MLCTFWLAEDFLLLRPTMTHEDIVAAMEHAEDHYDASQGFNWWHLEQAIEAVMPEDDGT